MNSARNLTDTQADPYAEFHAAHCRSCGEVTPEDRRYFTVADASEHVCRRCKDERYGLNEETQLWEAV